jgi:hypothetical protein
MNHNTTNLNGDTLDSYWLDLLRDMHADCNTETRFSHPSCNKQEDSVRGSTSWTSLPLSDALEGDSVLVKVEGAERTAMVLERDDSNGVVLVALSESDWRYLKLSGKGGAL